MQIVSIDNLHVMPKSVSWEKNMKKYFKMSSAANFTQNANHQGSWREEKNDASRRFWAEANISS